MVLVLGVVSLLKKVNLIQKHKKILCDDTSVSSHFFIERLQNTLFSPIKDIEYENVIL